MGKKELDLIIKAIAEAKEVTRKGHRVKVYISNDNGLKAIYPQQPKDILLKLQDDERIITIKSFPNRLLRSGSLTHDTLDSMISDMLDPSRVHFIVDTLDGFDKWYADHRAKRKSSTEDLLPIGGESAPKPEIIYKITYTTAREILLDNKYLLAKPDFDSENDLVFSYLYEHPNEKLTLEQIRIGISRDLTKALHKIIENLGFKGDLKKIFFDVSKTSILFRNPITREDLEHLGVDRIRLP